MVVTIVAFIVMLGGLVLVHELGHFIVAKKVGMQIDEFSIGFGPKLLSYKYKKTLYSLRLLPLGGFNNINGMTQTANTAGENGFCQKSLLSRTLVIAAGPISNLALPILLMFSVFWLHGIDLPTNNTMVSYVDNGSPAYDAGIRQNDIVISIDNEVVSNFEDIKKASNGKSNILVTVNRDGDNRNFNVDLSKTKSLGIKGDFYTQEVDFCKSIYMAINADKNMISQNIIDLISLVRGDISPTNLSGPIGIAKISGTAINLGWYYFFTVMSIVSVGLGIINLVPIPALDGGYLISFLIEAIRGKEVSEKTNEYIQKTGMILLIALMLYATLCDLTRILK